MKDIRLKEEHLILDGKDYILRCNMNVLADVQESVGGNLNSVMFDHKPLKDVLVWLSAMLNDYADEQGWPERFTPAVLGRRRLIRDIAPMVMTIVRDGLTVEVEEEGGAPSEEGNEKN